MEKMVITRKLIELPIKDLRHVVQEINIYRHVRAMIEYAKVHDKQLRQRNDDKKKLNS